VKRQSERKITRKELKGLEKFQHALFRVDANELTRWLRSKKNRKRLSEEIGKHMFDLGPATPPRGRGQRTGREEFFYKLRWSYREIDSTVEALRHIEFYIGRFPYRNAPVSKHRYLQFHFEAFLHEIYILEVRLFNCLTMLERQYRKDPRLRAIQDVCAQLREIVTDALKKLIGYRGSHVHQFRISETHIDRLEGIYVYTTLLPNRKLTRVIQAYYRSEHKKARKSLKAWIASANTSIKQLLDVFFEGIHSITFNKNGTVRYPSHLKF
jgi:hypothetical protein